MSQEKVNKYKEYKANRKEILKKEKRKKKMARVALVLSLLIVVGAVGTAIGITINNQYKAKLAAMPDYKTTSMVVQDLAGVRTE